MTRLAVAIIALAIGAWLTFLNPMNTPPDLSAAVDKTEPELITDLPEPGPLGSPPPPVVTGNIEYVQPRLPNGQLLTGELDRMAYDAKTDSIWMAQVLEPSRRMIYQYSIPNESVTTYEVPGTNSSGNRWSGGMQVGSDGTVWLAYSSTVAKKRPTDTEFQLLELPEVPAKGGDLVPGIWGATLIDDRLWVSRVGVQHLTIFEPDSAKAMERQVPLAEKGVYPLYFEPISEDRLFMTYGSAGGSVQYEQSAVVDLNTSSLVRLRQKILPFIASVGRGRIAAITPTGNSNLAVFNFDNKPVRTAPFAKETPFPGLQIRADEGFRSGGFVADTNREVIWFFMLDDRTSPEALESRFEIPDPDYLSAYFVRSSLDGILTERYQIHLSVEQGGVMNQLFSMYGRFSSGPSDPSQRARDEQKMRESIQGSPDKAIIPQFFPMVVDRRGDLWARLDGSSGELVHVTATDRR